MTDAELRELHRRLVATPSVSRAENAIAELLEETLTARGVRVERQLNNIWFEVGDAARPRLLLNSHTDTVPPADGWTADPWTPRETAERVIGLGANDAKGCVAALVAAALRVRSAGRCAGKLVVALTAEEEISGKGLAEVLPQLGPLDGAIVGEPTSLVPMTAQRGLLILKCTARGRSGHPANTPADSPDNAINAAAADIVRLGSFDWGAPHPLLGGCHAHPTMIQGGIARNVVPDACEFWLDIRTTPNQPHRELVQRLGQALRSEIQVHSERLGPVQTDAGARIVRACLRALPGAQPAGSPAMSDMVFLAGTPAVKIGPGDTRRSHTPDEYLRHEELLAGAAAYERIVHAFFADA